MFDAALFLWICRCIGFSASTSPGVTSHILICAIMIVGFLCFRKRTSVDMIRSKECYELAADALTHDSLVVIAAAETLRDSKRLSMRGFPVDRVW